MATVLAKWTKEKDKICLGCHKKQGMWGKMREETHFVLDKQIFLYENKEQQGPFSQNTSEGETFFRERRGELPMKTDIEIAQNAKMKPIWVIGMESGIPEAHLEPYGAYKAKINTAFMKKEPLRGKLVLVTAITPTPAGEGKTTTTIGLADGLRALHKRGVIAMREPSLGPVFGIKGGACGGGYAQVVPMEDINLHFTGDFHAIGAANNLLAAMLDNHIYQGNALGIDPTRITWKRCVDMNDRQLRVVEDGLGGKTGGVPRKDGYDITVASEIMAIFCLAEDIEDLKRRLSAIIVGYTYEGAPVTAGDLKAVGAMAALLKDAMKPNLVQTLEGTPALVHGGPFANIAHGCNSVIATRTALKISDYTITEAGFGADLGAEKFLDIKCRMAGLTPDAVVVVATARALKMHGGVKKEDLGTEHTEALMLGMPNLVRHVQNIKEVFGLPCVVAVNRFPTDTDREIACVMEACRPLGVHVVLSDVWAQGSRGGIDLAREVVRLCEEETPHFRFAYDAEDSLQEKIHKVVTRVYGGEGVVYTPEAEAQLKQLTDLGYGSYPVCIAKTQYSFSDDPTKLGAPSGFTVTVKEVKVSAGAGFVVVLTGNIMTMPGLPKIPAAEGIDVDADGKITGLF